MNRRLRTLRTVVLFCLLSVCSLTAIGQQATLGDREVLGAAKEIITTARYCALVTLSLTGEPQVRTIDPFAPDNEMIIWFATNPNSRKVREMRKDPRVALYYFDPKAQAYVTIKGIARLVNDPAEKAKRWKDDWKVFYPNRDKDYLLVSVKPLSLEIVNASKGIVGDPKNWDPPTITFEKP